MLSSEDALQKLKADLHDRKITTFKVMFVRYQIATAINIMPKSLESIASNGGGFVKTLDIDDGMRASLLDGLEKTRVSPLSEEPDLRWGAIFYNAKGETIHSLYINGKLIDRTADRGRVDLSGTRGMIDGNLITLNGILFQWFEATFRDSTSNIPGVRDIPHTQH